MGEYADSLKKKKVVIPTQAKKADAVDNKKTKSLNDARTIANNANTRESRTSQPYVSPKTPTAIVPKVTVETKNNSKTPNNSGVNGGSTNSGAGNSESAIPLPKNPPPPKTITADKYGAVKTPSKDTLNISSLIPQESAQKISRMLFEELSAIELSIIERHDTIDGIRQQYAIISNLSEVRRKFDAKRSLTNIEKGSGLSIYQIDLDSKIPDYNYLVTNGLTKEYSYLDESGVLTTIEKGFLYIDTNGDLIIELDNIYDGEQIQIQIDSSGTIYEVDN
jgi:hypothetical protein